MQLSSRSFLILVSGSHSSQARDRSEPQLNTGGNSAPGSEQYHELMMVRIELTSCGCFFIGSVQNNVGRGFEQPELVKDVSAHRRGAGTR